MASAWARPQLPVPPVHEVGQAFGGVFAVSERMTGDHLDALPPERMSKAISALMETLLALESVALPGDGYGGWLAPAGHASHDSWYEFLLSVPDRDDARIQGWREGLDADPHARQVSATPSGGSSKWCTIAPIEGRSSMAIFSPAMSSSMPTIASAVCWIGPTRWPATRSTTMRG